MIAAPALVLWKVVEILLALALIPGTVELLALTVAGIFRLRPVSGRGTDRPYSLTIVVPAHNEEQGIRRCIQSIQRADSSGVDLRVVVVADNCTDQTATTARVAGAEVLTRYNPKLRGKGYALNFAFGALAEDGIDGFAIVDADTEVAASFVTETARALGAGADATQCRYLVRAPNSTVRDRLVVLASGAYNVLRARGRANLGFSAGLYGNGFALAASTLRDIPYVAYSVVEDLEYHLMLLAEHRRVTFLDQTWVCAETPPAGKGADNQRARWEGGRMRMTVIKLPVLLRHVAGRQFRFLEACFDLTLPPLAFHVVLLLLLLPGPVAAVRCVGIFGLCVTLLHLCVAAFVAGQGFQSLSALLAAPAYIVWKLLLIPKLHKTSKEHATWVRTERVAEISHRPSEAAKP